MEGGWFAKLKQTRVDSWEDSEGKPRRHVKRADRSDSYRRSQR